MEVDDAAVYDTAATMPVHTSPKEVQQTSKPQHVQQQQTKKSLTEIKTVSSEERKSNKTLHTSNNKKIDKSLPKLIASLSNTEKEAANFLIKRKRYVVTGEDLDELFLGFDENFETYLISESDYPEAAALLKKNIVEPKESKAREAHKAREEIKTPTVKSSKKNTTPSKPSIQNDKHVNEKTSEELKTPTKTLKENDDKPHIVADNEEELNGKVSKATNARVVKTPGNNTSTPLVRTPQDEFYKKPFEYGWKRELVWRATPESGRDRADVYFISPAGKKIRTRHDIVPLLKGDLKMENFCWAREALGAGPEHEIVRHAKPSHRGVANSSIVTPPPPPVMGKRISKPKAPKGASPPPDGWTPSLALKSNNAALNSKGGMSILPLNSSQQRQTSSGNQNRSQNAASNKKKYVIKSF